MDLCTVVIPTFNREKFIKRAVLSVVNQTYAKIQIIVIDDGSTDDTEYVIKDLCCKYNNIAYVKQLNSGVSVARNKGINLAKGEFVVFLDSDDYFKENYIAMQIENIKKNEADITFCGCEYITNKSGWKRSFFPRKHLLRAYLQNRTGIQTAGFMIRMNMLKKYNIRFYEGCSSAEDLEFFSQCIFYAKRYSFVKEKLVVIDNDHENRLSNFSKKKLDDTIAGWNRIWSFLDYNESSSERKRVYEKCIWGYRVPAAIIYGLLGSKESKNETKELLKKYAIYLKSRNYSNGIRSIKLCIAWYKLMFRLL